MSLCAAFTYPDGRVGVMRPRQRFVEALVAADETAAATIITAKPPIGDLADMLRVWRAVRAQMTALTEAEAVRAFAAVHVPDVCQANGFPRDGASNLLVTDATGLLHPDTAKGPETRRWRACWRQAGAVPPAVDMPLARMHRMAEIRKERDRHYAPFDGKWFTAMGKGDTIGAAAIDLKRDELRDAPQVAEVALATCATPEELAAYEPVWP